MRTVLEIQEILDATLKVVEALYDMGKLVFGLLSDGTHS
jgi:hypothetical protein